jgi:hypothetical protein
MDSTNKGPGPHWVGLVLLLKSLSHIHDLLAEPCQNEQGATGQFGFDLCPFLVEDR